MSKASQNLVPLIAEDLKQFSKILKGSIQSKHKLMDMIMEYIVKRKGKQIRPLFVYLCAGALGEIGDSTHRGAVLIEILHTATLIHDDVVDEANYRRGFLSINSIWQNKVSVLVGDYLLAKGLILAIDNNDFGFLKIISTAVQEMSEGELLQLKKSKKLDITEEVYIEIIRQKTAVLLASCCAIGACSAGASPEIVKQAELFGEKIGIAFQLKDDLMDYGKGDIGKPVALDIEGRKLSLPLIHSLSKSDLMTRSKMKLMIRKKRKTAKEIKRIINFCEESGGLTYTENKMSQYVSEALELLTVFKPSHYRDSLEGLVNYVMCRSI